MPAAGREVDQVEFALQRSPGLSEQVAEDRRQRERLAVPIPRELAVLAWTQATTESVVALQQHDVVTQLGEAQGGGDATEPTTDNDDASHEQRLTGCEKQGRAAREGAEGDQGEKPHPHRGGEEREPSELVGVRRGGSATGSLTL